MLLADFINVGYGDAILLRETETPFAMLVDCGDARIGRSRPDGRRITAADYLRREGIRELDLLVLTHFHADHANGVAELLERVRVDVLAVPDVEPDDPLRRELLALAEDLDNELLTLLAAVGEDGTLLGYAGLLVVLDEGYITNVAVRPECRRNGIAQKLLQVFLDFAQAHKLAFLTLEVRASNYGAIALYGSRGFRSMGRRKNYYEHPKEDAIIMTKEFANGTEDPDTGAAADGL